MKKHFVLSIFLLSLSHLSSGQKLNNNTGKKETVPLIKKDSIPNEQIFYCRIVETEPKFKDGIEDWNKYLQMNLNTDLPKLNGAPIGTYIVKVHFIISKAGNVSDIKAITNYGYGMENEVVRIICNSPKWIPATRNGRIVNAYRCQLVTFNVCETLTNNLVIR